MLEGSPQIVFTQNLIFWWLIIPCKISEPYENPFWEKSKCRREKEREKNAVNSEHLVPWQRTQAAQTNIFSSPYLMCFFPLPLKQFIHFLRSKTSIFSCHLDYHLFAKNWVLSGWLSLICSSHDLGREWGNILDTNGLTMTRSGLYSSYWPKV